MSIYWKAHYDSICRQSDGSLLKQVGKTVNGQEIPESQVQLIAEDIITALQLQPEDSIIDLCCGNGLITRRLAPLVKNIIGIDYTQGLIKVALEYNKLPNIEYINLDVLHLDPGYFSGQKKIVMYEALQHFSTGEFAGLLTRLGNLKQGSLVFLGSIPDKGKLNFFYDTEEKYTFFKKREEEGKPHMGRWWLPDEIRQLAHTFCFTVTFMPQHSMLYTSHYRFNALLEKY